MIYLILGDHSLEKEQKINEIRKKTFPSKDAFNLDYESLNADKLDSDQLKKSLISLPALAKQRLILIRNIAKLSNQNKKIILEFVEEGHDHAVLILDCHDSEMQNKFIKEIRSVAKVIRFASGSTLNIFDVTRALSSRKQAESLKILSQLLDQGEHPLKLLGGLVWFWGKCRERLSPDKFSKGLRYLQETDSHIKRSRLKPENSLEILVVKLSLLIT